MSFRRRVVVAVPAASESRILCAWLDAEGFEPVPQATARAAGQEIAARSFDLLVADHTFLFSGGLRGVGRARSAETPVIVLGATAAARQSPVLDAQFMFVERPVDRATFLCTVAMALMDARRERRSPRRAVVAFDAVVNGVASHIIDVSREGVRLELPRTQGAVKPQFVLRVPLVGVGVTVQRIWTRTPRPDERIEVMWCGGALVHNTPAADERWRAFIDTLPSAQSAPGSLSAARI